MPKYRNPIEPDDVDDHLSDVSLVLQVWLLESEGNWTTDRRKTELLNVLQNTPFLLAENCDGVIEYRQPTDIYFKSKELTIYFESIPDAWFLADIYQAMAMDAFSWLGVAEHVRATFQASNSEDYVILRKWHGNHKRGLNRFDPNCTVASLSRALSHPSIERSKYIWEKGAVSAALSDTRHRRV